MELAHLFGAQRDCYAQKSQQIQAFQVPSQWHIFCSPCIAGDKPQYSGETPNKDQARRSSGTKETTVEVTQQYLHSAVSRKTKPLSNDHRHPG
jgi:hypothetical protein